MVVIFGLHQAAVWLCTTHSAADRRGSETGGWHEDLSDRSWWRPNTEQPGRNIGLIWKKEAPVIKKQQKKTSDTF